MDIDLEELACVVDLLKAAEFSEFIYEKGDVRLVVRRGPLVGEAPVAQLPLRPVAAAVQAAAPVALATPSMTGPAVPAQETASLPPGAVQVTAPLLGSFYSRPKPGEAPFVKVGDRVERDTVLCIVEVMKLMNSVTAGRSGVLAAVHAVEGQLVEFGQALFSIVPDAP
jgi:acetyl-CoA carboxylase biotin carboxyl carrier protein